MKFEQKKHEKDCFRTLKRSLLWGTRYSRPAARVGAIEREREKERTIERERERVREKALGENTIV